MTLCIVTGWQCNCQPDEGVFCPDYKPDWYAKCLMDAITATLAEKDALARDAERMQQTFSRQLADALMAERMPQRADGEGYVAYAKRVAALCADRYDALASRATVSGKEGE